MDKAAEELRLKHEKEMERIRKIEEEKEEISLKEAETLLGDDSDPEDFEDLEAKEMKLIEERRRRRLEIEKKYVENGDLKSQSGGNGMMADTSLSLLVSTENDLKVDGEKEGLQFTSQEDQLKAQIAHIQMPEY